MKSIRSYQVRTFEVFVAQASNDDGKPVVFSSVPAEADRRQQQLRAVLHRLGATQRTPGTILSDGADGPRSLGEAAMVGPTHHVLDWLISRCVFSMLLRPPRVEPDATAAGNVAGGLRGLET